MTTHRIQSGETLTSIARRFHTTVDALAKAYGIADPNKILAGHTLQIPDGFDKPFRKADGDRRGLENRFRDEPAKALELLRAEQSQRRAA